MNFKTSTLWDELEHKCALSENTWDYLDACADEWEVKYSLDFRTEEKTYTLSMPLFDWNSGAEGIVTYVGNLDMMVAVVEYLAHVNDLLIKDSGMGADYE